MTIQEFLEWMETEGAIRINTGGLEIAERILYKEGYFLDNKIDLNYDQYGDE